MDFLSLNMNDNFHNVDNVQWQLWQSTIIEIELMDWIFFWFKIDKHTTYGEATNRYFPPLSIIISARIRWPASMLT